MGRLVLTPHVVAHTAQYEIRIVLRCVALPSPRCARGGVVERRSRARHVALSASFYCCILLRRRMRFSRV
ncbi:hypothetical protein HC891_02950 [Candidatus Gracilibacteria bacterium]|nr:hypothetical protein [Candidatus Gracilibacteria bacterium]